VVAGLLDDVLGGGALVDATVRAGLEVDGGLTERHVGGEEALGGHGDAPELAAQLSGDAVAVE
jgi:hypothetical protein